MNLAEIRAELPVLDRVAYLNAGTFGPLPRRTTAAMVAQHEAELRDGRSGAAYWERVRELRRQARASIAELIGSRPESVALTRSTSEGCAIAVASLGLSAADEIVTTDAEHFGLLGALHASGARVRVARVQGRPRGELLGAIEAELGPHTRLVAVSHVTWTTGAVLPLSELAARVDGDRTAILVDGAQSAGAIPVDVGALRCDFYTVSGQKWLLGPDGTGGLYVRPGLEARLEVPFPSYFSQVSHDETGAFEPAEGAMRFDPGTVAVPSLAGLVESLEFGEAVGPQRFELARTQVGRCCEMLARHVDVLTEPGQATLVSFRPSRPPEQAVEALGAQGVVVRHFPGLDWLRASVGFWTTDEELERLSQAVQKL
jgi:L-cysteine/cystine lyase